MHKAPPADGEHILPLFKECAVVRVAQSPFNRLRWMLTLACGQEVWLTRSTRPTMKRCPCLKCATAAGAPMGKGAT
jgi:hypothetical protein